MPSRQPYLSIIHGGLQRPQPREIIAALDQSDKTFLVESLAYVGLCLPDSLADQPLTVSLAPWPILKGLEGAVSDTLLEDIQKMERNGELTTRIESVSAHSEKQRWRVTLRTEPSCFALVADGYIEGSADPQYDCLLGEQLGGLSLVGCLRSDTTGPSLPENVIDIASARHGASAERLSHSLHETLQGQWLSLTECRFADVHASEI